MSVKLRLAGTGLWLTKGEEFLEWLDTDNARLWLYGIPGQSLGFPSYIQKMSGQHLDRSVVLVGHIRCLNLSGRHRY